MADIGGLMANMLAGGTQAASNTATRLGMDKIKDARNEAFRREGWGREDQQISDRNTREDKILTDRNAREDTKIAEDRAFRSSEADKAYGRQVALAQAKGAKSKGFKVTNTDDGVLVTKGDQAFRVVEGNLVPMEIGLAAPLVEAGEEVTEEKAPGFFSRLGDALIKAAKNKDPMSSEAATFSAQGIAGTQEEDQPEVKVNHDITTFNPTQKSLLGQAQSQLPEDTPIEEIVEFLNKDPRTSKYFK